MCFRRERDLRHRKLRTLFLFSGKKRGECEGASRWSRRDEVWRGLGDRIVNSEKSAWAMAGVGVGRRL